MNIDSEAVRILKRFLACLNSCETLLAAFVSQSVVHFAYQKTLFENKLRC